MTQHLIDTTPKLVTCTRCGAYVFACQVGGLKVAADLRPLDVEAYRAAIIAGKATYDQVDQAGRPHKLQARTASSSWPPYAGRNVLADHMCGTRAMNVTAVETTDIPPPQPRAVGTAQHGVTQESSASNDSVKSFQALAASPVIPHRSKREWVTKSCDTCKVTIGDDYRFCGVKQGKYWLWVQHDYDCEAS